jgi:sugar transferase (PEP-CTERM/EpsH1 system associated)
LKVLFVAPYLPSLIRVRPYHFIRQLAARHQVHVLAVDSRPAASALGDLRQCGVSVDVVGLRPAAAVRSCLLAGLRGDPLQAAVCQSSELDARFDQLIAEGDFDVVHVEHLRAAALVRRLPRRTPRVFDAVDSISLLLRRTLRSSHSVRQRLTAAVELARTRRFEAAMLREFDKTLVTSPEDQRVLSALTPGSDITVVPNGVDLDYFRPLPGSHDPATLVFSGKMSYHANASAVLYFAEHILPLIRAVHPEVRLRIVGSNPPRSILALANDPAVEVTGYVPDMRTYIGTATVAVCPMTVKVGIQNKLLEAMAMEVPVVATRLAAEGLAAAPGRDLLVAADPREFASHTIRLLNEPDLATGLARAGRDYVERNHRWDRIGARLEELYVATRQVRLSTAEHTF